MLIHLHTYVASAVTCSISYHMPHICKINKCVVNSFSLPSLSLLRLSLSPIYKSESVQFIKLVSKTGLTSFLFEGSLFWVVQGEVHHRWKNHHVQTGPPSFWWWHTMVHVLLMFLSEWREFPSAPFLAGGWKKTWWQLASPCCWNCACHLTCFLSVSVTRKDLQFSTWTDPSFQRHYRFCPMTLGSRSG